MPKAGANTNISRAELPPRGLRQPLHVGYVATQDQRLLQPFMAAPVRPGESLVGLSLRGESIMRSIVAEAQAPLTYAELAYWYIPLSALDSFFVELYAGSAEDNLERGATSLSSPGTSVLAAANPVSGQGHQTPGLQAALRPWAGEIGGASADNRVAGSEYAPYVSWATYKVATDWYDLDISGLRWQDADLFDDPPALEQWVRSATNSHFTSGAARVDDLSTGSLNDDLSSIVERMFLLAQPEMTYAEILGAAGVNVNRKLGGLSMPLMKRQHVLHMRESDVMFAQFPREGARTSILSGGTAGDFTNYDIVPGDPGDSGFMYQRSAVGHLRCDWSDNLRRNMFIDEPGLILGTICWYSLQMNAGQYSAHFDITRMTGPGHWGRPGPGGIDEEDFIKRDLLYRLDGTTLQPGDDTGGAGSNQTGDGVLNFMNLYLNGDITSVGDFVSTPGTDEFRFFDPTGDEHSSRNRNVNHKFSTQLHVLSDMVG